jgi:hypothetical protein
MEVTFEIEWTADGIYSSNEHDNPAPDAVRSGVPV